MQKMPLLKPGDSVEIIAPASRCTDQQLSDLKALLTSWQLNCVVAPDIFGDDLLCANSDTARFLHLKKALYHPENKAIICARGGYGCMRLIPELIKLERPETTKILVGMSDITALMLFLQQQWQWPTLHAAPIPNRFSPESISAVKTVLFGNEIELTGFTALNEMAKQEKTIQASMTGGNLCLVQTSIGTSWQMDARDKIVFLEEVGERGYRVDRMLEHLRQANILKNAKAILFGDFLEGNEPDGSSLIAAILERFAKSCEIPVMQINGIGHGFVNSPLRFGVPVTLKLGKLHTVLSF